MSPETEIQQLDILEESSRIANELLDIEREAAEYVRPFRAERIAGIRKTLGYTAVSKVGDEELKGLIDTRIEDKNPLITPEDLAEALPLTQESYDTTLKGRQAIEAILDGEDDRLIVIVGPCSIHDPKAALEYAHKVADWREQYGDKLEIVMRFYPEKPRTELGWKGFIIDPRIDGSDDINQGIVATRMLALQITGFGVPLATERLNAITPQYINGLVAYDAIGARNTTDQKAREYGSGTSSPVGFKNTPEGSIMAALQAVVTARGPHTFPGIGMDGRPHEVNTVGNPSAHIILRGDQNGPNYDAKSVATAVDMLNEKSLLPSILIDMSHGNSGKKADKQVDVVKDVCNQLTEGEAGIKGVMIESNLVHGKQEPDILENLDYGKSITDECADLEQTESMLDRLAESVQARRPR